MNQQLLVSDVQAQAKSIGVGLQLVNYLGVVCLVAGLMARKYIGLEAVLTLQLVFYSQILV